MPLPCPRARRRFVAASRCTPRRSTRWNFSAADTPRGRTLKVIFQSAKRISVDSDGSVEKDGTAVLKQVDPRARQAGADPLLADAADGPNRYAGTLTDAAGPVRVDVERG